MIVKAKKKTPQPQPSLEEKDRPIETRPLSVKDKAAGLEVVPLGNGAVSEQFCGAYTDFSVELFKKVSAGEKAKGNNGSVLISPDSVETALAMMENGAAGDTLSQMEAVLITRLTSIKPLLA